MEFILISVRTYPISLDCILIFTLGPKMYIAFGTQCDDSHRGSTKLHMDLTDAVNTMLWAAGCADGSPGYAIWHIFSQADSSRLDGVFRSEGWYTGNGDAVHSQQIYLTPAMLTRLADGHGIIPYIIHQHQREAVFIPAHCAHQVRIPCSTYTSMIILIMQFIFQVANIADAIKMACDFISIENIKATHQLVDEYREHRITSGWGDDVLQFYTTIWYAWISLSELSDTVSSLAPNVEMADHDPNIDHSLQIHWPSC